MRKIFICGNWKMHKNVAQASSFFDDFKLYVEGVNDRQIVLAVPFTLLNLAKTKLHDTNIKVAAQNIYKAEEGAFTGEVSAQMVEDFAEYVIIGHSERRRYFSEDNQTLNLKINLALNHNLNVIYCVGESLEERDAGRTEFIVENQLREGLSGITVEQMQHVIIAYEPVWAIGTGNTATPDQAETVHKFIRSLLSDLFDEGCAENIRVIYGGSVNKGNAAQILEKEDIDGCLPGGASLDAREMSEIVKS